MFEIAFAAVFGFAWGTVAVRVLSRRPISRRAFVASFVYLVSLTGLAIANFELGIFEQKRASEFAFEALHGGGMFTFLVQALINVVPFTLTAAWWAAIGTNIAVLAVAFGFLFDRSRAAAEVLLAPAVLNFGLFALRDPLIGVLFLGLTVLICRPVRGLRGRMGEAGVVSATVVSRPETLAIYVAGKASAAVQRIGGRTWLYALLPLGVVGALVGLTYLPRLFGISDPVSLAELPTVFEEFFAVRANRTLDESGSSILGGQLVDMPLPARLPIQIVTFFVLPLPWEIRSPAMLLAFIDSLVFADVTRRFWRVAPTAAKRFLGIYVVAVSIFVVNYGNMFRLRMPAYFILAAGLLIAAQHRRRGSTGSTARSKPAANSSQA